MRVVSLQLLGSYLYPRFKTYSLPSQYRSAHSGSKRRHKAPLSMYDSPQGRSKFYHVDNGSYCYHSPSQSSLYSCSSYQQSLHPNQSQYQPYASSLLYSSAKPHAWHCDCSTTPYTINNNNMKFKDVKECINTINTGLGNSEPIYYDCDSANYARKPQTYVIQEEILGDV